MKRLSFVLLLIGITLTCNQVSADLIVTSSAPSSALLDTSSGPASTSFTISIETTDTSHLLEQLSIGFDSLPPDAFVTAAAIDPGFPPFPLTATNVVSGATGGILFDFDSTNTAGAGWTFPTGGPIDVATVTLTLLQGTTGTFDLNINAGSLYRIDNGLPGPQTTTDIAIPAGVVAGTTFTAVPEPSAFLFGSLIASVVSGTGLWRRARPKTAA